MYKLIGIAPAIIPIVLFLRAIFMRSKEEIAGRIRIQEAARFAVWLILACAVVYLTVHVTHAAHRLIPVPSQRWHRTTLSPFLSVPLPSQFLHFCFFLPSLFCIGSSRSNGRAWREGRAKREHEAAASDAVYLSPSQRATRGHEFLIALAPRN
jgi:hypothetical protein